MSARELLSINPELPPGRAHSHRPRALGFGSKTSALCPELPRDHWDTTFPRPTRATRWGDRLSCTRSVPGCHQLLVLHPEAPALRGAGAAGAAMLVGRVQAERCWAPVQARRRGWGAGVGRQEAFTEEPVAFISWLSRNVR